MTGATDRGIRIRPMTWVVAVYALMPVATALIWFATVGEGEMLRHRQVRLVPVFAVIAILAAVTMGLGRHSLRGLMTPAERIALAVFAAVFLGTTLLVAPDPVRAISGAVQRLVLPVTGLALCYLLSHTPRGRLDGVTAALILQPLAHLPVLAGLYVAYAHLDPPAINWLGGPIGYWHVRIWGMVLAAGAAAAFGAYAGAAGRDAPTHAAAFAVLTVLATLLAWSGSRGSMLGLVSAIVLTTLVFPRRTLGALPVTVAALLLGAALSLALTAPFHAYGLMGGLAETVASADLDRVSAGRLAMWRDTLALIAERPLFGFGHDQFFVVAGSGWLQPHNAPLNLVFDFGLIGGGALAFLILSLWWRGTARIRREGTGWKLGGFAVLTAMATAALFDGVLYHEIPILIVCMAYAVLFATPPRRA